MSASDLVDYFRLDASYDPLTLVTRETIRVSNGAQRKRQVTVVKEWKRIKRIGRGAFGTVWLDRDEDDEVRAVKEVAKEDSGAPLKVDYKRELLALGRLSKVSCQLSFTMSTLFTVYSMATNSSSSRDGSKTMEMSSWSWNILRTAIWRGTLPSI